MNRELYRSLLRAIVALFLILLVKLVSMLLLKDIYVVYSALDIILSFGVIFILLRFRHEFNEIQVHEFKETGSIVTYIVVLLVILTLYGTFLPYSGALPYGFYSIIFFILALVPVYALWHILYKNTERLPEILGFIRVEKRTCSCGRENPGDSRFCNRCGLPLGKA